MKIIRVVLGKTMGFELTKSELYDAFCEQEHLHDKVDIEDIFDQLDDEEIVDDYGFTRSEVEGFYDDMAYRKRHYMDKYELNWDTARDEAIARVIEERKAMKQ